MSFAAILEYHDALDIVNVGRYKGTSTLSFKSSPEKEPFDFGWTPLIKQNGEPSMARIFYGWWVILACFLIALYRSGCISYGFTAFFEPIVEEFGWSYTKVSIAFSFRGLEMGILSPLMGFLVDRFGPRKLAFSGVLIIGFGLILLGLIDSLVMFYSAFALFVFGASGCS
ncbi:MAG: MFS transporter, partial [Thermoplasmata archaeon]